MGKHRKTGVPKIYSGRRVLGDQPPSPQRLLGKLSMLTDFRRLSHY